MRMFCAFVTGLVLGGTALAQEKRPPPPPRFGVPAELDLYPHSSPKQLLVSIGKTLQRSRTDYLLAHLLEPSFGDAKVAQFYRARFNKSQAEEREHPDYDKRIKQAFEDFIKEVEQHMVNEPKETAQLQRLLKDGNVEEAGTTAKVTHKDVPNLVLSLRQTEGRWYMLNEKEVEKAKK